MGLALVETTDFKIFTLSLNSYYIITTNTLHIGPPERELIHRRYMIILINAVKPIFLS
jgi:hypothetical protein